MVIKKTQFLNNDFVVQGLSYLPTLKPKNGQAPSYIIELLNIKFQIHGHNLRSTQDTLALQIPQIRTKVTLGDRSFFFYAAPRLWNKLPVDIRKSQTLESFKSKVENLFVLNVDLTSLMTML